MAACSSCDAPITWVINDATNRRMPLDAATVDDGNVVILAGTMDGLPIAHVLARDEVPPIGRPRHVSHFATCPNAKAHRRR